MKRHDLNRLDDHVRVLSDGRSYSVSPAVPPRGAGAERAGYDRGAIQILADYRTLGYTVTKINKED